MTLTLVLKNGSNPMEYICEISNLYHLPFKSYANVQAFADKQMDRQANKQAKNYMTPPSIDAGHKNTYTNIENKMLVVGKEDMCDKHI